MPVEAIFLGILIGFIYYELVGLTPGGIVVPGYIALYLTQPLVLLITLIAVLMTYYLVKILENIIILYGRRAFVAAVLIGFFLKWIFETQMLKLNWLTYDLAIIGYIIPGLMAHEMRKQGIVATVLSCTVVSMVVGILIEIQGIVFS